MRWTAAVTVLSLLLTMVGGAASGPGDITGATALAVGRWVAAVRDHAPGRRDTALGHIRSLTFEKRLELHEGMGLFLSALQPKRAPTRNAAEKYIVELSRSVSQNPGANAFFRRAAVLHSDTALRNHVDDSAPVAPKVVIRPGTPRSPLLAHEPLLLDKDGEIMGEAVADWNWPFARSLLDLIEPKPSDDPFVATWYHATTAFMLQKGLYGDALPHLERAAVVLPDDARILFDRASYFEIQGLPVRQVLLSEEEVIALRARRSGRPTAGTKPPIGIPLPEVANDDAERLFRRALRADPSLVEARVRLARLLYERKRHEEAATELTTALSEQPSGIVAFYAHLFAGRAAQARGRLDDAAGHYREARALFPGAQSALLAQSHVALLAAAVPASLEPIQHLERPSSARDPWWLYHLAAGRNADDLLRDMWSKVTR